jgi:hypothetical protein
MVEDTSVLGSVPTIILESQVFFLFDADFPGAQEYVACLNEFRLVLRQNNLKMSESHVTEEANHVSAAYHELLARANALSDAFSRVGGKYKVTVFRDVLECRLYLQIENGKICLFFKNAGPDPAYS